MLLRARLTAGGSIGPVADVMAGVGPIVAPGPAGGVGRSDRPNCAQVGEGWGRPKRCPAGKSIDGYDGWEPEGRGSAARSMDTSRRSRLISP
jgi:hypothetical protein